MVRGAARIDAEFHHAARNMDRAGNAALAIELARVAQVDEGDIGVAVQRQRLLDRDRLDRILGLVDQILDAENFALRHDPAPPR